MRSADTSLLHSNNQPGEKSRQVLFQPDIAMFSGSGSGCAQGTPRREWRVLAKRCNAAGDRFPARPQGATQRRQYGVAALDKGAPFSAGCALS